MTTHPPSHPDCYTSQQGRQPCACPVITPESLALPTRRVYTCADLGVCQHRATPCAGCHRPAPALDQANTDGTCAHTHPADAPLIPPPWEWVDEIKAWARAGAVCALGAAAIFAAAGWAVARFCH